MQAMTTLYAAWASAPVPAPATRHCPPTEAPSHLRMQALDGHPEVIRVSFSLGRLLVLTRCEREVARWANAGHSNAAIASLRQTSRHTVARQMSSVLSKLGIGARVGLATVAELNAWSPPGLKSAEDGVGDGDAWWTAEGLEVESPEALRIWRELGSGLWSAQASIDVGDTCHVAIRRVSARPIDWARLSTREREAIHLAARGLAQKNIAMTIGVAPSTLSSLLAGARRNMGFTTLAPLVRAYCATRPVIEPAARRS